MKAILKRLLLLKYNWKFEKGFVLNEYGWINKKKLGKVILILLIFEEFCKYGYYFIEYEKAGIKQNIFFTEEACYFFVVQLYNASFLSVI